MLMLAKVSLKSFIYKFTETLFFPIKKTRQVYNKYMIKRVLPFEVLIDTDSICVFSIFICKPESSLAHAKFSSVLFEVVVENETLHRFDTSHEFWERYSMRNVSLKKKLGSFSIENIGEPCMTTVAVNPKEYIETFISEYVNKKHEGIRKDAPGIKFENYSRRINSIAETETDNYLLKNKSKTDSE